MAGITLKGQMAFLSNIISKNLHLVTQETTWELQLPTGAYQGGVRRRVGGWVPPDCLVDVDVVHEEGDQVAEEELQLEQDAPLHGQLGDLAVPQGNHGLSCQGGAGQACP